MKLILRGTTAILLIGIWIGCGGGEDGADTDLGADTVMTDEDPMAGMDPGMQGDSLRATLTADAEVPGPGDPEGSGEASVSIDTQQQQLCYNVQIEGIEPTAAHIHSGAAGASGPPVVTLNIPGETSGCVDADSTILNQIQQNPSNYYVNVHTSEYGAGAVRGQLSGGM